MRDSYFDNLKGILIILVVIGHFILPMDRTRLVWSLFYIIYLFHMPMFAMISGYFAKGIYRDGKFRMERLLRILWLYIVFKCAVHVTENLAAGTTLLKPIDFFFEGGSPWYLLAMIWWYLSIPFACMFKPKVVIAATIFISIFSGYQVSLGDDLAMCRTLAFAPFFYGGYYLTREQVDKFVKSKSKYVFAVGDVLLTVLFAVGNQEMFGQVRRFVYGMNYRDTNEALFALGGPIRVVHYICTMIMILGIMAVTPSKKTMLSGIGQRTLPIYILHRLLRDMMEYWGFYMVVTSQYRKNVLFVVVLAVVVTFVLGQSWIDALFKKLQCVPDWCYRKWGKTAEEE